MTVPSISAEQMQEVDRIAIEESGPNIFQMMENAGRSLAALAIQKLGEDGSRKKIVVLSGHGGNGGGGICAARHLANRGLDVRLCFSRPEHLSPMSASQKKTFQATSGKEVEIKRLQEIKPDLIIDALIGYSLSGPPTGLIFKLIEWANEADTPILSLDIPTGLDATTGNTPGIVIHPKWTLTLALPKNGLLSYGASSLYLADIGIPDSVYHKLSIPYETPFDHRFIIPLFVEEEGFSS